MYIGGLCYFFLADTTASSSVAYFPKAKTFTSKKSEISRALAVETEIYFCRFFLHTIIGLKELRQLAVLASWAYHLPCGVEKIWLRCIFFYGTPNIVSVSL